MMSKNNSLLKTTSFKRLKFWDYFSLNNKLSINSRFPLVELSKVITQRKDSIKIDDASLYKRCRVQVRSRGIILRDEVFGEEIKTKTQFLCKENDFLVAEIDAKVGGYGIVPKELINAIVSSHYFLFELNLNKLLPEYLSVLCKCSGFSGQIKATGSTNYAAIRPFHVLEYIVPLPSVSVQNELVKDYKSKVEWALSQEKEAQDLESEIETYLLKKLVINSNPEQSKKKTFDTVNFNKIDRWAVDSIGRVSKIERRFTGKFPLIAFNEIIISYQYGLSEKSSKEIIGHPMLRMNNIKNSVLDLSNLKYIDIEESLVKKFKLNKGDLLFNRTNSKELVGKTALFDSEEVFTFASYLIRVVINTNIANREYINFLFNSSILNYQKKLVSRQITGQANINSQEMREFLFPLPPIELQEEIAMYLSKLKRKIKELRSDAIRHRNDAMNEFEEGVFLLNEN
jgi:type I restriction enzyme S subunit